MKKKQNKKHIKNISKLRILKYISDLFVALFFTLLSLFAFLFSIDLLQYSAHYIGSSYYTLKLISFSVFIIFLIFSYFKRYLIKFSHCLFPDIK